MKKFYLTILILLTFFFTSCGVGDSPEQALEEIQEALNTKDVNKFSARVDTEKLFAQIYDDSTVELAKNCEVYGKKYPRDPYFKHDGEFIKKYNAEHRDLHLNFARQSYDAYFANLPAPKEPHDNPYAYVAHEFTEIHKVSGSTVENVEVNENSATITLKVEGDGSLRGLLVGLLTFKLGFDKVGDKWILTRIENIEELTPTMVDKAELVWINL